MAEKVRVGTVIGSIIKPNEEAVLKALRKIIHPDIQLELILNNPCPENLAEKFFVYEKRNNPFSPQTADDLDWIGEFFTTFRTTCSYIGERNPDILFNMTKPYLYGFIAAVLGKHYRIPSVVRVGGEIFEWHLHSSGISKLGYLCGIYPMAYCALLMADRIVSVSDNLFEMLKRVMIPTEKVEIIPPPVDGELFQVKETKEEIREMLDIPLKKIVILIVGRMEKLEKVGYFPELVGKAISQGGDLLFLLVGKTNQYQQIIKRECGDYVKIVGEVPHSNIPYYYKASDLLMHLSTTEGGVANTVLEAHACGLPAISTPAGGAAHVIDNTFNSVDEFVNFLSKGRWSEINLPPEFRNKSIGEKYTKVFHQLRKKKAA